MAAMLPDPSWQMGILGGSAQRLATAAPAACTRAPVLCAAMPSSTAARTARHNARGSASAGTRNPDRAAFALKFSDHAVSTAGAASVSAPDISTGAAPDSAVARGSEPSPKAADMAARLRVGFRMEAARGYGNVRGAQRLSEFATDTFLELLPTQVRLMDEQLTTDPVCQCRRKYSAMLTSRQRSVGWLSAALVPTLLCNDVVAELDTLLVSLSCGRHAAERRQVSLVGVKEPCWLVQQADEVAFLPGGCGALAGAFRNYDVLLTPQRRQLLQARFRVCLPLG